MHPSGPRCTARRNRPDTWEIMSDHRYEDRSASFRTREDELRFRISQMESLLLSSRKSESYCCAPQAGNVPKVFPKRPDSPVRDRDIPTFRDDHLVPFIAPSSAKGDGGSIDRQSSCHQFIPCATIQTPCKSRSRSQSPKKQPSPPTFFQKVMENAKSILTLKCNVVHPTFDEHPTRENDVAVYTCNVKQKKSNCSCDYDEESTRNDYSESYSQDVSNSLFCKTGPDSISTIKSRKTTSIVVNTCSYCNTSTSTTDTKAVAEGGSQYTATDFSRETTRSVNKDACCICPSWKDPKKDQGKVSDTSKKFCTNKTCAAYFSAGRRLSSPNVTINSQEPAKKQRSKSQIKEVDIQCAFIGSPMLNKSICSAAPQARSGGDMICQCMSKKSARNIPQKQELNTVTDMATREMEIKGQIENLQNRERNYDTLLNNYQNMTSNVPPCCCSQPRGQLDKIDKISHELKLENKVLKDELMQMKMDLKHCLEKVEGPMRSQLETEKMRCVQLEHELGFASKNMVMNQDAHMREMNALKLQLCMACSNINELNSMNRRLKDEMTSLDAMCTKLEDDLVKQKINEAETLKLLTKRKGESFEGICSCSQTGVQEKSSCDSNLHVIARKLSKTLRESEPCEECANLPAELTGAAKCIKDLSDLVDSRKVKKPEPEPTLEEVAQIAPRESPMRTVSSQVPPETADEGSQCMEGQRGDEGTTTLIPPAVLEEHPSAELEVKVSPTAEPDTTPGLPDQPPAEAAYFTAAGEPIPTCPDVCDVPCPPTCDTEEICLKKGKPCPIKIKKEREEPEEEKVIAGGEEIIPIEGVEVKMEISIEGEGGIEGVGVEEIEQIEKEYEEQEVPTEGGEGEKVEPVEEISGEKPELAPKVDDGVEMVIEKDTTYTVMTQPESPASVEGTVLPPKTPIQGLKTFIPEPCTEVCGSDQPCARGEPCFMIKGQDLVESPEALAIPEQVERVIEPIIPEKGESLKFPSDAVIEPPDQVPSEVKKPDQKVSVEADQKSSTITEVSPVTEAAALVSKPKTDGLAEFQESSQLTPTAVSELKPLEEGDTTPPTTTAPQIEEAPVVAKTVIPSYQTAPPSVPKEASAITGEPSETMRTSAAVEEDISEVTHTSAMVPDISYPTMSAAESIATEATLTLAVESFVAQESTTAPPTPISAGGVTAPPSVVSRSKQTPAFPPDRPFVEERTGHFPFDVDTKVEILDVPPTDLHVTTTITSSGTLEVITEGPEGLIETTLVYKPDGAIEVVTHITEDESGKGGGRPPSGKPPPPPPPGEIEMGAITSVPQDSFLSGTTDLTGLETVTESTKETSYAMSSYASDFGKTVAAEETTAEAMGFSVIEPVSEGMGDVGVRLASREESTIADQGTPSYVTEEVSTKKSYVSETLPGREQMQAEEGSEVGGMTVEDSAMTTGTMPGEISAHESKMAGETAEQKISMTSEIAESKKSDAIMTPRIEGVVSKEMTDKGSRITEKEQVGAIYEITEGSQLVSEKTSEIPEGTSKTTSRATVDAQVGEFVGEKPSEIPKGTSKTTSKATIDAHVGEFVGEKISAISGGTSKTTSKVTVDAHVGEFVGEKISAIPGGTSKTTSKATLDAHVGEFVGEKISAISGGTSKTTSKATVDAQVEEIVGEKASEIPGETSKTASKATVDAQVGEIVGEKASEIPGGTSKTPSKATVDAQVGEIVGEKASQIPGRTSKTSSKATVDAQIGEFVGEKASEIPRRMSKTTSKATAEETVGAQTGEFVGEKVSEISGGMIKVTSKGTVEVQIEEFVGERASQISEGAIKMDSKRSVVEIRGGTIGVDGETIDEPIGQIADIVTSTTEEKGAEPVTRTKSSVVSQGMVKGIVEGMVKGLGDESIAGESGKPSIEEITKKIEQELAKDADRRKDSVLSEGLVVRMVEGVIRGMKSDTAAHIGKPSVDIVTEVPEAKTEEKAVPETAPEGTIGDVSEALSGKTSGVVEKERITKQAVTRRKRDCGCQATPQAERSCQCCECKDVGVSTSKDSETITDENMVQASPIQPLQRTSEVTEVEPDTHQLATVPTEVSHISQDFAQAVDVVESTQIQGTADEVSTIQEGLSIIQDQEEPKDAAGPEYTNKRGRRVRDRPSECTCSDESEDEDGEKMPTLERAAQCECDSPIETDDRSEGRPSSGSDTDDAKPRTKKPKKDDSMAQKPSFGPGTKIKLVDSTKYKGDQADIPYVESTKSAQKEKLIDDHKDILHIESDKGTEMFKKSVEPVASTDEQLLLKPQDKKVDPDDMSYTDSRHAKPRRLVESGEDLYAESEKLKEKTEEVKFVEDGEEKEKSMKPKDDWSNARIEMHKITTEPNDEEYPSSIFTMEDKRTKTEKSEEADIDDVESVLKDKSKKKVLPEKKRDSDEGRPKSDHRKDKPEKKTKSKKDDVSTPTEGEYELPEKTESLEVPDSAIVPPSDTLDKRPRKKRSSSQRPEKVECDCCGVCQCIVCSPKAIAERKAKTGSSVLPSTADKGRPCWCRPPSVQLAHPLPQVKVTHETAYLPQSTSKPVTNIQHPAGCHCVNCLCAPCSPCPPIFDQEAFLGSTNLASSNIIPMKERKRISVDDVFGPTDSEIASCIAQIECQRRGRSNHPPNCECVDCLCLPKIRKIAELKEHPVIRDEKQVYQVKCYCENTRKPVSTSRIPISTNSSTGPPKAKNLATCTCGDCKCSPCSDVNQTSKSASKRPPETASASATPAPRTMNMTLSELARMCDCQECQCIVCFDKPPKKDVGADKPQQPQQTPQQPQPKGTNKNCCCKGDCVCEVCPVELLAKQAAAAPLVPTRPAPPIPTGPAPLVPTRPAPPIPTGPAPLVPTRPAPPPPVPRTMTLDHPEDCDCPYCLCPNAFTRNIGTLSPEYFEHDEDCDCDECICPQAHLLPEKPKKRARTPKVSGSKLPVKISKPSVTGKASSMKPPGCTCGECICPGKDSALRATGDRSYLPQDCDCPICSCPGRETLRSVTPLDQSATLRSLPDQNATLTSIPEGSPVAACDCIDCQCNPCADPNRRKGEITTISPCDCPDCKCEPCADPRKRRDKGDAQETGVKGDAGVMAATRSDIRPPPTVSAAVGSTENRATHPPDCICEECLCQPEEKHEPGCCCPECKCMDCFSKKADAGVHAEGCQCTECKCAPCDKIRGGVVQTGAGSDLGGGEAKPTARAAQQDEAGVKSKGCTCDVCKCEDCFSKSWGPPPTCTCAECVCVECMSKAAAERVKRDVEESKSGPPATIQPRQITHSCHCIECACDVCTHTGGTKQAASKKGCTCDVCQCADCGNVAVSPTSTGKDCECPHCECKECPKRDKQMGVPETRSMLGKVASQPTSGAAARSAMVREPVSSLTDPPPFEVPIRKACTCGKCECPECNKGYVSTTQSSTQPPMSAAASTTQRAVAIVRSLGVVPPATAEAPPFEIPIHIPCTCGKCDCSDCNKSAGQPPSGVPLSGVPSSGMPPSGVPPSVSFATSQKSQGQATIRSMKSAATCNCQKCDCSDCKGVLRQAVSGVPTSVSFTIEGMKPTKSEGVCNCQRCDCTDCNKKGINVFPTALSGAAAPTMLASTSFGNTSQLQQTTSYGASPSLPPSASQMQPSASAAGAALPVSVSFAKSQPSATSAPQGTAMSPRIMTKCDCPTCTCAEEVMKIVAGSPAGAPLPASLSFGKPIGAPLPASPSFGKPQASVVSAPQSVARSAKTMTKCDCPTCTCAEERAAAESSPAIGPIVSSKDTGMEQQQSGHPAECTCPECCACKAKTMQLKKQLKEEINKDEVITSISKLDNEALMRKIKTDKEENCKCREQIKELRRALDKIKCSCTEAEMKAIRSTTGGGKPFIKQASAFGQTMSGLKFALNNLQEKCKAKDKLIEVMTGELKMRTSSNTFDKVLNTNGNVDVPDYDKAGDIKPFDRLPDNSTNVLFPVTEEREIGHTNVHQRSSDISGHKHKKKSKLCKCGKQHKDRDNTNVDLSGFEVVDIRRITQDSIIIKWKPPQSSVINGYDIFVNGVNKSKVMSGGRTSAMVHSLDLSSTIQITIYAVTKCGRCEPPAIAIYEINT